MVSFDVVKTCNLEGQASVVTPVSSPYLARQLSSFLFLIGCSITADWLLSSIPQRSDLEVRMERGKPRTHASSLSRILAVSDILKKCR